MKNAMKIMIGLFFLGVVAIQAAPVITQQVTPGTISYQGRLQTPDGTDYVNGIYTIDFKLYDEGSSGTLLWGATYKPYVNNGFFSVILGQTQVGEAETSDSPLTVEEFWKAVWIDPDSSSKDRHLGITVYEDENNNTVSSPVESFPRQQLLASPFAIQAQYAQQASGNFSVPGDLSLTGSISNPNADLYLTDDVHTTGGLSVGGNLEVQGSELNCSGGLNIDDYLYVKGDVASGDSGPLTITDSDGVSISKDLSVGRDLMQGGQHVVNSVGNGVRIEYANVSSTGSLGGHSAGISRVTKDTGTYTIYFSDTFASAPAVQITGYDSDNAVDNWFYVVGATGSSVTIESNDHTSSTSTRDLQDAGFSIVVVGVD